MADRGDNGGNGDQASKEMVKFEPRAPVKSKRNLQSLLKQNMEQLKQVMPKHVTPERLVRTLLMAVNRQPDLLACTQESIMESVAKAGELGLDLSGTLGEAYLVPFNNNVGTRERPVWAKQAVFIPGYRGLARLARQSGDIQTIEAEVVYEIDLAVRTDTGRPGFVYRKGTDFEVLYQPHIALGDDGKLLPKGRVVGCYALVAFKDGGFQADFMTREDIERVRQASISKNSPAWKNHWDEMGKKTVFRRLCKWLQLSGEKWDKALEADSQDVQLADLMEVLEVSAESRSAALADKLGDGDPEPEPGSEEGAGKDGPLLSGDAVQELSKRLRSQDQMDEGSLAAELGYPDAKLEDLPQSVFTKALSLLGG